MYKIVQGNIDPIPEYYSKELQGMVSALMEKNIQKRPMVSQILNHEFVQSQAQAIREDRDLMRKTKGAVASHIQKSHSEPIKEEEKKDPFEGMNTKQRLALKR